MNSAGMADDSMSASQLRQRYGELDIISPKKCIFRPRTLLEGYFPRLPKRTHTTFGKAGQPA
jgi:hypothetical protein